jgi:hypothetical protein
MPSVLIASSTWSRRRRSHCDSSSDMRPRPARDQRVWLSAAEWASSNAPGRCVRLANVNGDQPQPFGTAAATSAAIPSRSAPVGRAGATAARPTSGEGARRRPSGMAEVAAVSVQTRPPPLGTGQPVARFPTAARGCRNERAGPPVFGCRSKASREKQCPRGGPLESRNRIRSNGAAAA